MAHRATGMNNAIAISVGLGLIVVWLGVAVFFRVALARIPGVTITSWFRSPRKNVEVGGVKTSLHLIGWGWDLVPDDDPTAKAVRRLGLQAIREGNHIHAQVGKF